MENVRRKRIFIALVVTFLIIFIGNRLISLAATSTELKEQQKQNQEEINDTKEEQEKIRSQMTSIQKEVEELNNQISNYENEIMDLSSQIEDISLNIENTQKKLDETQKELEEKEELLRKRIVASYKAGETKYLDVLLSSQSLTNFLSNYYYIELMVENDKKLIQTIQDTKEEIEASKVALEESKLKLEDAKKSQELKKQSLDITKREKNEKAAELSEEDQKLQKQIEEMQAEDSRIRAAIKKAQAQEAAQSKPNNGGGHSSSSNPGGFIYPVPSAYSKITTGLYYSNGSYHGAVDFGSGGIYGQPVYAAKSGTVILTQNLTYSYGTYIMIDHHDGTYTLYAHGISGSICVSEGQSVSQGQQIMRVGSTGNSSGAHLHFEVRVSPGGYNNRVNPMNYL